MCAVPSMVVMAHTESKLRLGCSLLVALVRTELQLDPRSWLSCSTIRLRSAISLSCAERT